MCYLMFKFSQFNLHHDFVETFAYKHLKIRFHSNIDQDVDKVWSLKKNIKIVSITKDILFKNAFQNYRFKVVWGDQLNYEFTITYFPLMNPHDFVMLVHIMTKLSDKEIPNTTIYNEYFYLCNSFKFINPNLSHLN